MPFAAPANRFATIAQRLAGGAGLGPYKGPQGNAGGITWHRRGQLLPSSAKDWAAEAGDPRLNSTVAACLGWLADKCASTWLTVRRFEGGKDAGEAGDHPLYRFFGPAGRPNPDYPARAFWSAILHDLKLDGNAYAIIGRDMGGLGRPAAFWWEPARNVFPYRDPDSDPGRLVTHYLILRPEGWSRPLPASEVVHFREGIDPADPMRGLSRFRAGLRSLVGINRAETFVAAALGNSGGGKAFVPDKEVTIDDDQCESIKIRYEYGSSGDNAGRVSVLETPGRFEDLGRGPQEMALDTIVDRPEATVLALLGVQAISLGLKVGDQQRSYNNTAEADALSIRNGLCPPQDTIAEHVGHSLLGAWGDDPAGLRSQWDRSRLPELAENIDARTTRAVTVYQAGMAALGTTQAMADLPVTDVDRALWYAAPADPADPEGADPDKERRDGGRPDDGEGDE